MSRDLNVDQIKKIWMLDLVIRSGSLRRAALEARVSPSAVSQSLTSLENSVGKPLLVRGRGRVEPTHEALELLEVIRPAFEAFDRLREMRGLAVPKLSWLNFGAYESIAVDILPGFILSLRRKMPHLRLRLRISRTANLMTMVRKGELCSALITEVDDLGRFYVREVARDRLGLYVGRKSPAARIGWKAVRELGIGTLAPGKGGLPRYYTKFLKQLEPERPFLLSDSFETLRAAAAAGALVSVLPERVALRNDDLTEVGPPAGKSFRESGAHAICVVSRSNCDPGETDFLAHEAARLFSGRKTTGPIG